MSISDVCLPLGCLVKLSGNVIGNVVGTVLGVVVGGVLVVVEEVVGGVVGLRRNLGLLLCFVIRSIWPWTSSGGSSMGRLLKGLEVVWFVPFKPIKSEKAWNNKRE